MTSPDSASASPSGSSPLLEVRGLEVRFASGSDDADDRWIHAVDGVDLSLGAGETLALVGESGCGKSTVARAICGLAKVHRGSVSLAGHELVGLSRRQRAPYRSMLQMVFQDPEASLNPRMTVSELIREPLLLHRIAPAGDIDARVCELLERVGLDPSQRRRHPHVFSGGQRQRIAIARALAVEPKILICDEVTSALDVSIQSQILNLLADLQDQLGIALLFITHDLAVVRHMADRVAVMYLGQIVEQRETEALLSHASHPYSESLLAAVPQLSVADGRDRREGEPVLPGAPSWLGSTIQGDLPSPSNPPPGCRFHTRCPRRIERCSIEVPSSVPVAKGWCRCFLADPAPDTGSLSDP
jgi:oligopeptide transport system ATP-binding protein